MKTKFGAIIVAGSGKIGGHVASKNRSGSYLRTKVSPINPQSIYQSNIRNRLATIAVAWAALGAAGVAQWNAAVGAFSKSNIFGDSVKPSGFNLFQMLNCNLMQAGGSMITTPPVPVALPAISALSVVVDNSAHTVIVTYTCTLGGSDALVIKATPCVSCGRTYVKNQYRIIKNLLAADVSPADVSTAYIAKFGNPGAVGQRVSIQAFVVNKLTGQAGIPAAASTIIVA